MTPLALVVEDDAALRAIYKRVLTDIDYNVMEAPEGATAIQILESETPDIIFLDILLPHVNGVDVIEYIFNEPRLHKSHVIIVSSNSRFASYADELPSAQFVLKPIRPAQIRDLAKSAPTN